MAAPWVSGTVALMMAAAGRPLSIHEIRGALIGSVDPHAGPSGRSSTRLGYGYLNVAAAVEAARAIGRASTTAGPQRTPARSAEDEAAHAGSPPVWVEDAPEAFLVDQDIEGVTEPGIAIDAATEALDDASDVEATDEDISLITDAFDESIDVPFAWEDVHEALEAFAEDTPDVNDRFD
jgi:hypothetical protein